MTQIPAFPRVVVTIHPDTSGEVTIQGISHPIPARGDLATTRQVALGMVTMRAAIALGRPVRVTAHDPRGTWPLIVHPDGRVESADTTPALPRPAGLEPPRLVLRTSDGHATTPAGSVLAGRNPEPRDGEDVEVLLLLPDPHRLLSKTHARIDIDTGGRVTVTDRDSTNGTAIRMHGTRRTVPTGSTMLLPAGAVLFLADTELVVELVHG